MGRRHQAYRWVREHPFVIDALMTVPLILVSLLFLTAQASSTRNSVVAAEITGIGMLIPLAWRRTRPVLSSAGVALFAIAYLTAGVFPNLPIVAVPMSVYALAAYGPRWAARAGLTTALIGSLLLPIRQYLPTLIRRPPSISSLAFDVIIGSVLIASICAAIVLIAWLLGDLTSVRRRQMLDLADRNRRLEIEREQETRLAASAERARIAREMHDVVAHSLSVMIAQADGGRYAAAADADAARRALGTISDTGRSALADMRRLLGVLRSGDDDADVRPQPTLADVPSLVSTIDRTGLPASLEQTGPPRPLPTGAELAIYRIVQESLTNTMKHGGPNARAHVRISYGPAGVEVRVRDDGRGAGADQTDGLGSGIRGMNERASLYGGDVTAGPSPGGGFAVHAYFPYQHGPYHQGSS
ncbi:sensor histidine kinase [Spelaeicoccus albus]|uniref:histidine kinase n=1 Tax=Spelaeicoccus albus TaxID=1280376 RepID=A0A7Z0D2J0_9MICO|nr:sensor histidine kinase [Spelaeicoccus albus]NYI67689.1 signal transduction histidine kinase [Spelaeicoccus albus]